MARGRTAPAKGFQDPRYRELVGLLADERKRQGLSQQQLADKLSTHQQFVSRYELGERRLDAIELVDVSRALGLSASELLRKFEGA